MMPLRRCVELATECAVMRSRRDSAAYRIAFTYSAAFALATIALGSFVYFTANAAFMRQLDARIEAESNELVADYRAEGPGELRETIATREGGNVRNRLGYAVFDLRGNRVAGVLVTPRPAVGWQRINFFDAREGAERARALAVDLSDGTRLVVAADSEALEHIDRTILALFAIALFVVIALGVVGALILGGYLREKIGRIGATAEAIISGDLLQRMPIGPRNDEFDQLSRTLNRMLDQIAALLDNLRQVSSDLAHDLRTPLARLRNQLDRALSGPEDARAQRAALQSAIERSDEVLALFAAILRISEIEGGGVRRSFARVDLTALVTELCEMYVPAIDDNGRQFSWAVQPNIAIEGDRELVAQAIINLVNNAQVHTPRHAAVHVRLTGEDGDARLAVSDNGPGVPVKDRERIVKRFTRLESSRSTPGHGLGLNLVAAIASVHRARLLISDNAPGLIVTLIFPRVDA
jgi:signal transduction histidine kinase